MKNPLVKGKKYYPIIFFALFLIIILASFSLIGKIKNKAKFPNTGSTATITTNPRKLLYGSNIDMSQLLPTSRYYVKNSQGEDLLDIAHRLGINALRISSVLQAFSDQTPDTIYTKDQWDTVLNKMNTYGIKAIIIADTHTTLTYSSEEISDDFLPRVKKFIIDTNVGSNSAVYAFDLKNEPSLSTHNLGILQQEATMIKQTYPNVLVTVGGWKVDNGLKDSNGNPEYRWNEAKDAQLLTGIVDFYSPHLYGFDRSTHTTLANLTGLVKGYLDAIELVANNKPILFSEFGSANGGSISDQQTVGSKELQANTYYAMYQTLNTYNQTNLLGSTAYVLYSRNQFPDSWAIVKDKGDSIYPAGYVLQKFALGYSQTYIAMPYTSIPDNITISDMDNLATKRAKVNDIILLAISGSKANQYQMTITPSDAVQVVQNLQYNAQFNKFYAILKVLKSGNIPVSVAQISSTVVDSTTLIVQ